MHDARTWALVENLSNLDQIESSRRESASKSSLMASRYRVIAAVFVAHADSAADPVLQRLDLIEARNFTRLAEIEEAFAARGNQDLVEIANLKQGTLALLQRSES
ncbi:MAG: hypothetical protein WAJ99_15190 [Candidatus Sulfotelmatobacter sp.]|jgi:hypothetical protein